MHDLFEHELFAVPALFEDSVQQSKRAAVIIGRFQPPHAGHYAVLDLVKKYIRDHRELQLDPVPVLVVIDGKETGKDKTRNPLSADERISFIQGSGKADGVKILKATSAIDAFYAVRTAGYEPIAIATGSDRATSYLDMLDKYFKTPQDKKIKHYVMTLPRNVAPKKEQALDDILAYVDSELPTNMVSGTLARHAVKSGDIKKFAIIVGLANNLKLAKIMFNKIKTAGGANGAA